MNAFGQPSRRSAGIITCWEVAPTGADNTMFSAQLAGVSTSREAEPTGVDKAIPMNAFGQAFSTVSRDRHLLGGRTDRRRQNHAFRTVSRGQHVSGGRTDGVGQAIRWMRSAKPSILSTGISTCWETRYGLVLQSHFFPLAGQQENYSEGRAAGVSEQEFFDEGPHSSGLLSLR